MFTIIICDKHITDDCRNKYYIYLKPLLDMDKIAFCEWNTQGTSLDEAVPELKNLIRDNKKWRAVVVNDSCTWSFEAVNKRNPFNFADCRNTDYAFGDFSEIEKYRLQTEKSINSAMINPLLRLSLWLCGAPIKSEPAVCYGSDVFFEQFLTEEKSYYEKLKELELSVKDVEVDRYRFCKYKTLKESYMMDSMLFNPPCAFLAICERTKNVEKEVAESAWKAHTEYDYSRFAEDNLYPEQLRYLICDVPMKNGVKRENAYLNFLTIILLLASNDIPSGALRANRAYLISSETDASCIKELCNKYNAKLEATLKKIRIESVRLQNQYAEPVDRDTAERCFETGVEIPVVVDSYFDEDDLMAAHDQIGLAKDSPTDEEKYWYDQYRSISRLFVKYLREPRRAVKVAVKDNFAAQNKNKDMRALRLNEFQKENVVDFLNEEETEMVSTETTHLYNTSKYTEKMDKANETVQSAIERRMTKSATIKVCLIAVLAYFVGFLPLIFSDLNSLKSLGLSLCITFSTIALFLGAGIAALFYFKKKLIDKFKSFNECMTDILSEIHASMAAFSKYLSNACNVMREFSVLDTSENHFEETQNILNNHERIIKEKIQQVNELFAEYIEPCGERVDIPPFEYDFTVVEDYRYEVPYSDLEKTIEFMQSGNEVKIPIDYINAITIEREELYD